nr:MAG TPA: hypothetical protein [Caudoviricetes sp.]
MHVVLPVYFPLQYRDNYLFSPDKLRFFRVHIELTNPNRNSIMQLYQFSYSCQRRSK